MEQIYGFFSFEISNVQMLFQSSLFLFYFILLLYFLNFLETVKKTALEH